MEKVQSVNGFISSLPKIRKRRIWKVIINGTVVQGVSASDNRKETAQAYIASKYPGQAFTLKFSHWKIWEIFSKVLDTGRPILYNTETREKEKEKKMKNTKIIMNRIELENVLYNNAVELDTLIDTEYAIGGELLDEARNNNNMIEYFFPMGDEGEFIEVDNDGYVINDAIYR